MQGFGGILQVDSYAGYNRLIAPGRAGTAPIAGEGVRLIGELYATETDIRGLGLNSALRLARNDPDQLSR